MKYTIQLTPRLRSAADWVPQGAALCDVGTDHAYLPTALMLEGKITCAIASDIRPGPLKRAAVTIRRYGLEDSISLRLGAGLEAVRPEETDTVSICGMGGEMICGILGAASWTKTGVRLILQPQRSQDVLRRWLSEQGYAVRSERVVREGNRWYTLLLAEGGIDPSPLTPGEELAGRPARWIREPERLDYLSALTDKLERLLRQLEHSSKPEDVPKADYLQGAYQQLCRWKAQLEKGVWPK